MKRMLALWAVPVVLAGCAAPGPPPISHVVLFALKDPGEAPALLRDADREIPRCAGVASYAAGPPMDIGRPEVDGTYHAGLVVGFRSADDYRAYLADPRHAALAQRWKPRASSVRIFDIADNQTRTRAR